MQIIKKYIKWILLLLLIITIMISVTIKTKLINEKNEIKEENINENLEKEEEIENKIKVDIKGAVKEPGVYELENNSRTIDIIEKAKGLTEEADTSYINLSKKLKDEMVVIIYTKEEIKKYLEEEKTSIKQIDNTCVCPKIENNVLEIKEYKNTTKDITNKENNATEIKININTATIEELQTISGLGTTKAKAIVSYREQNGYFSKIEDIKNVSGIGDALYEKIKDSITV